MAKLFVLSGGPCSGKTSLIKFLESKGFPVLHETARKLVQMGIIKQEEFKSKERRDYIQRIIFEEQLKAEESVSNLPFVFLDRSLVDGIAYYWVLGLEPPSFMFEILSKKRYDSVFILDQLQEFEIDEIRHEDPEQA
ncbi:MAG TPA: ATP-binding protein, partial [Geobacterales bacterium]|nr:ATP-binding protein [Geobacterales bacterium]